MHSVGTVYTDLEVFFVTVFLRTVFIIAGVDCHNAEVLNFQ